jgi:N-acetylglucosamine kinase-like BadF-type ATPase
MGDEGSGYALVLAALRAVAQAVDGCGPETTLTARFLEHFGLTTPQGLVGAVYRGGLDRTGLAALARHVFASADEGDDIASAIVEDGARELGSMVVAVACQLHLDKGAIPLALAGGVLQAMESYRNKIANVLASSALSCEPIQLVAEPAEGAARLALKLAKGSL